MRNVNVREACKRHEGQQHDAHSIGRDLAKNDRVCDARTALERAGGDEQQAVEHRERSQMNKPDFKPRLPKGTCDQRRAQRPDHGHGDGDRRGQQGRESVEANLHFLVARAARDMKEDNERCAGSDCNGNDAIEAKRRHQVAELGLAEHPAEHDQHDKLRSEPEDARTRADQQNAEIALVAHPQPGGEPATGQTGIGTRARVFGAHARFSRSLDRGKGSIRRLSLTIAADRGRPPRP